MHRRHPRTLVALLALLALPLLAAPAGANTVQSSVMQDDDNLLYRGEQTMRTTLTRMKGLGADTIRVTVLWSIFAENARKNRKFNASNPKTYPARNWDKLDLLVRLAMSRRYRMRVLLNVTGPGPSWAHAKGGGRNKKTWKPKPKEFAKFVKAVGKRYGGRYRDENGGRVRLPKVTTWSLWNEPNQGGWLTPQSATVGGQVVPQSPIIYRDLWFAGRVALKQTGHDRDLILLGETAPLGEDPSDATSPLRPGLFIREFFCLDGNGVPYTGAAATARKCDTFKKFGNSARAAAYAHHAYTKNLPPLQADPHPDAFTTANLASLTGTLDAVAATTGLMPQSTPVAITEFGYETNPPDPFNGVSLGKQAEFINVGDWITYLNPRVFANSQFLLKDVPSKRGARKNTKPYWSTYQSGLYTTKDRQKPSWAAYAMPIMVVPTGNVDDQGRPLLDLWGQLRFRPDNRADVVTIQYKPQGGTEWVVSQTIEVTDPRNFYTGTLVSPGPGSWRAVWSGEDFPKLLTSREVAPGV